MEAETTDAVRYYELLLTMEGQPKFESRILACAMTSAPFYAALRNVVCTEMQTGFYELDFKSAGRNKLWKLLGEYYDLFGEFEIRPPPDTAVSALIKQKVASGDFAEADANAVAVAFNEAETEAADPVLPAWMSSYQAAVPAWVSAVRADKAVVMRSSGLITTEELTAKLERAIAAGSTAASMQSDFGDEEEDLPGGMRTPWPALTASTNGFVKRTSTLFVAERGAGKTVMATQIASFLVAQGYKGLYIYTEQTQRDLEARIMCQIFSMPMSLFAVKGIRWTKDPKPPEILFKERERFKGSLVFDGYMKGVERSITKHYAQSVDACAERLGRMPDFVVVDWPGNALIAKEGDPEYRGEYGASVQLISKSALRHGYAAIAFAQASAVKARNKKAVDGFCIAENTSLDASITSGVGLSKLTWGEESKAGAPVAKLNQYFHVFKSRIGVGRLLPVKRNFGCQRIEEGHILNEYNPIVSGKQQIIVINTHPELQAWCDEIRRLEEDDH
jgi:hypothetical protein